MRLELDLDLVADVLDNHLLGPGSNDSVRCDLVVKQGALRRSEPSSRQSRQPIDRGCASPESRIGVDVGPELDVELQSAQGRKIVS